MKVLTVVENLGLGGTERAAENFARAFASLGQDSRVLALRPGGHRAQALAIDGVPVLGPEDLSSSWVPDVIHLHSNGLTEECVGQLAACFPLARIYEQNVFSQPTPWTDRLELSFQLTGACLAKYRAHRDGAPSVVVPNPISPEAFWRDYAAAKNFRSLHGIPMDAIVLGRIGQPITYKWSPLLLRAFHATCKARADIWLITVGAPREVLRDCHRSPTRSRIVSIPRLVGDDLLRGAYSAIDVFVHAAAQGESFGYVLVEAMLCETPVVTISTPWADNSQAGIVGHNVGGLVAETPREFVHAVSKLIESPALRGDLGRRGRRHVVELYDAHRIGQLALNLMGGDAVEDFEASTLPRSRRTGSLLWDLPLVRFALPKMAHGAWRWIPQKVLAALASRLGVPIDARPD